MSSLSRSASPDQIRARILHQRPYHPWWLMPLAEYLARCGYSDSARTRIVDGVDDGLFLASLVVEGSMDSADLAGAEVALEAGREWRSARTLTHEPFLPGPDEPDPFEEVAEFDALPEPYEPTPKDWEDYRRHFDAADVRPVDQMIRDNCDALQIFLTFYPE